VSNGKQCHDVAYCAHAKNRSKLTISQLQVGFYFWKTWDPRHDQDPEKEEKGFDEV
jgi:hypothetical protein